MISGRFMFGPEPLPNNSTQVTPTRATRLSKQLLCTGHIDIRDGSQTRVDLVHKVCKIPAWRLPQGALPILAVRLEPQFNGETTEVTVTLLRGHRSVTDRRTGWESSR